MELCTNLFDRELTDVFRMKQCLIAPKITQISADVLKIQAVKRSGGNFFSSPLTPYVCTLCSFAYKSSSAAKENHIFTAFWLLVDYRRRMDINVSVHL